MQVCIWVELPVQRRLCPNTKLVQTWGAGLGAGALGAGLGAGREGVWQASGSAGRELGAVRHGRCRQRARGRVEQAAADRYHIDISI